ncbi:MAG: hypothetical protein HYZ27_08710, partial [Deltaproteobacteria bacterium]|nr:hypothetical protein [Deltaproteobacteria bacterium]
MDEQGGVWLAAGESFVLATRDRFSVHRAPSTVNKLAVDDNVVWIATDDGVVRFDIAARISSRVTLD